MQLARTIVVVNDFAHINGGAGLVALSSAIGLAARGHRIVLFSAVEPVMAELRDAGVRIVVTGQFDVLKDPNRLRAATQGLWNRKAWKAMSEVLDSLDPATTIVHVHSWTKALSSSVVAVAIRRGFRVVCTLHDYFMACPNGGFFDYRQQTICSEIPLSTGCLFRNCDVRSYPQKLWRAARLVVQREFSLMPSGIKHFITVSDFSAEILRSFLPRDAKVSRVDNPINIVRRNCVDPGANRSFIYVGRLSPEKGVNLFLSAANRLGIAPVLVGEGESREEIRRRCPAAQVTGWLPSDRVTEYLVGARALVLPSLWYETQGLVVAEAAALGVPAIVADTCAAREMVSDGHTGLWFRGGDETDLVKKMCALQDSDDMVTAFGRAAYDKYWRNPCTMPRHIEQLEICYQQLLH